MKAKKKYWYKAKIAPFLNTTVLIQEENQSDAFYKLCQIDNNLSKSDVLKTYNLFNRFKKYKCKTAIIYHGGRVKTVDSIFPLQTTFGLDVWYDYKKVLLPTYHKSFVTDKYTHVTKDTSVLQKCTNIRFNDNTAIHYDYSISEYQLMDIIKVKYDIKEFIQFKVGEIE